MNKHSKKTYFTACPISSSNVSGFDVVSAGFKNARAFDTDAFICFTFMAFDGCRMFRTDDGAGGGIGAGFGTDSAKPSLVSKLRLTSFNFSMQASIASVAIEIGSERFEYFSEKNTFYTKTNSKFFCHSFLFSTHLFVKTTFFFEKKNSNLSLKPPRLK